MNKVNLPEGQKGKYIIEKFNVPEGTLEGLRLAMQGRGITPGDYTRLVRLGPYPYMNDTVMSDTPAEMSDHSTALYHCLGFTEPGNVLIGGLGIGMVLSNLAILEQVKHIHVLELEQDVVDLVWPTYKKKFGDKISIEICDVLKRKPKEGEKYDYAWWDIWDNICGDNTEQFKMLRRRWCRRIPKQDFWCEKECKQANKYF